MKILFWVPYPTAGASNRYRVEQYLPYLRKAGIDYTLRPFWSDSAFKVLYNSGYYLKKTYHIILGTIRRCIDVFFIFRYDLVFIHREAYPIGGVFFENIIALAKKPIVFDFDDAIFLSAISPQNSFVLSYKNPRKIAKIIKMSNHVIAGNRYLANFAMNYNSLISIIPTPIDTDKYCGNKSRCDDKITIGWIGSITTMNFLDSMRPVFLELTRQFSNIQFKVIGGKFSINGLSNIISKPWSIEEELEDLRTFDIGIMPMPDNDWTRGKCGFKAIIYMGMGIPCVCSAVGFNNEIISNGVNGFLASTEYEWVDKLSLLINDPGLRSKIGSKARIIAEEKFSLKANVVKFLEVLNSANKKHSKKG